MFKQGKYCVFTLNNYSEDDVKRLSGPLEDVDYICFQKEVAPKTKTPHLQGYVQFVKKKSLSSAKKILGSNIIHIEKRGGTAKQARDYCKKPGGVDFFQSREWTDKDDAMTPGKRTDLDAIGMMLASGKSPKQVYESYPTLYWRYQRMVESSFFSISVFRNELNDEYRKKNVVVFWGRSGTGKTFRARQYIKKCYGGSCYDPEFTGGDHPYWFTGYVDQRVLFLDDFRGSLVRYSVLLKMLDGYNRKEQVKGGFVITKFEAVVITSCRHPSRWYENIPESEQDQLMRRIVYIDHMDHIFKHPSSPPVFPVPDSLEYPSPDPDTDVKHDTPEPTEANMPSSPPKLARTESVHLTVRPKRIRRHV